MRLEFVTDKVLHQDCLMLVRQERELVSQILHHLKEIDRRRSYADFKCGSLFDYCVKILKYSEGQASRRVNACRLLRELPSLASNIESGSLNLTQLNQANQFFREEKIVHAAQKADILAQIMNQSTRETERTLGELKKEGSPRKVNVILYEETVEKIKRVKDRRPKEEIDTIIQDMCSRELKRLEPFLKRKSQQVTGHGRHVPKQTKEVVWKRDKGQCTNCGSTFGLQYDHIHPYGLGGKTTAENLRLLCMGCNQRKAVLTYGKLNLHHAKDRKR